MLLTCFSSENSEHAVSNDLVFVWEALAVSELKISFRFICWLLSASLQASRSCVLRHVKWSVSCWQQSLTVVCVVWAACLWWFCKGLWFILVVKKIWQFCLNVLWHLTFPSSLTFAVLIFHNWVQWRSVFKPWMLFWMIQCVHCSVWWLTEVTVTDTVRHWGLAIWYYCHLRILPYLWHYYASIHSITMTDCSWEIFDIDPAWAYFLVTF